MSGYNYNSDDEDFENEVSSNSGGGLRKMLEEALGEVKSLKAQLNSDKREKSATELLKSAGLDPAIAELIPQDADPKAWIEEKAHLFGLKVQGDPNPVLEDEAEASEIQVPDDSDPALVLEREARAAMNDAQESGSPAHVDSDLLERMDKITSEDELIKFFQSNGGL